MRRPASVHAKSVQHKRAERQLSSARPIFLNTSEFLAEKAELNRLLVREAHSFYAATGTAILWQVEVTTSEV
jgi:hypothetical protein